jgi:shikimate kinase
LVSEHGGEMEKSNIVLVGFMGTGKTTVGRLLSEQTGMPLVDMDTQIEQRTGKSITEIFATDGEARFRELERELVRELSARGGQIVSTGGGIVLNPANISDYEQTGLVVCLLASAETVIDRVKHDTARPLLAGDKQERIVRLMEERRPLYAAIRHKIATDGLSPESVAGQIIDLYRSNNS